MATHQGFIMPIVIDTYDRQQGGTIAGISGAPTEIVLGKQFSDLAPAAGGREYTQQPAMYREIDQGVHGEREYAIPKGEFFEDKQFESVAKPPTPREQPLEISWKKAIFREE